MIWPLLGVATCVVLATPGWLDWVPSIQSTPPVEVGGPCHLSPDCVGGLICQWGRCIVSGPCSGRRVATVGGKTTPIEFEYDASGRMVLHRSGSMVTRFRYEDAGRTVVRDTELSGEATFQRKEAFDADGRIIRSDQIFLPTNAHFAYTAAWSDACRSEPTTVDIKQVKEGADTPVGRIERRCDKEGRVTALINRAFVDPARPVFRQEKTAFSADSVTVETDEDGDGVYETRSVHHLDRYGHTLTVTEHDVQGAAVATVSYDYSCWPQMRPTTDP